MTAAQIKTYLKGVFDIEMHRYVLEKTIAELSQKQQRLARPKQIPYPRKRMNEASLIGSVQIAGTISGILGAVLMFAETIGEVDGFWDVILLVVLVLFSGVVFAAVGGVVFGLIVWLIRYFRERARIGRCWERDMETYEQAVNQENDRLRREERQKAALGTEITALQNQLTQTNRNLSRLYGYGVLDRDYRNLYAVAAMYSYFNKGRTHSLQFDSRTGDQGAYNLYESERRMDRIITNTEEILYRLDDIAQSQYELAMGLQNASRQVSSLCNKVTSQLSTISGSMAVMERNTGIIAYNTACIESETRFMAWMTALYGR